MPEFLQNLLPILIASLLGIFALFIISRRIIMVKRAEGTIANLEKIGYGCTFFLFIAYIVIDAIDIFLGSFFPNHFLFSAIMLLLITGIECGLWFFVGKRLGYTFSKSNIVGGCLVLVLILSFIITQVIHTFPYQGSWYSELMGFSKMEVNGSTQKIALIDSGISKVQTNPMGRQLTIDTMSMVNGEYDTNGHGSGMFYILNITTASEASVLSIRVMEDTESISGEIVAKAILKAIEEDCTVINLSIGSYHTNEAVEAAIYKALENNITVVASAGDYGDPDLMFPANMDGVIAVGAIDAQGDIWKGTNAPDDCTILAPGVDIDTFEFGGSDPFESTQTTGTSQATAIISGYVACLRDYALQNGVELSNQKIIEILTQINQGKLTYMEGLTFAVSSENSNVTAFVAPYKTVLSTFL